MPSLRHRFPLPALALTLLLPAAAAKALEIETPTAHAERCTAVASGAIETGDRDRLQAALPGEDGAPYVTAAPRLCLDSAGGDFGEAAAIAEYLVRQGISTHVPYEAQCLGACAFAFMGGTRATVEEDTLARRIDRSMHAKAVLGFRPPQMDIPEGEVTRAEVARAHDATMLAAANIVVSLDSLQLDRTFALQIFAVPSGEYLYVDTIARSLDANLRIEGLGALPEQLADAQLREICERVDPELRPERFASPDSTRTFSSAVGIALSPTETGARRGAWLTGYRSEGDLYWQVCEVRWAQPADGAAGVSARVLQQAAWNGQSDAPTEAPPTAAEVEGLIDQAVAPFAFFEPVAIFPGDARLADLASDEAPVAPVARAVTSFCAPTTASYRVVNVQNFATLRAEPGFDAEVREEVARDSIVTPAAADDSAVVIRSGACAEACLVAGAEAPTDEELAAAEACRASNDVWWRVTTATDRQGWMSSRFLAQP